VISKVDLPTNDLTYDPYTQQLWASVPGSAGERGNSVVPIDANIGTIGKPLFIGSEPSRLALSDDGHFLYVALDGSGDVRRIDLRTQTVDPPIALGSDKNGQRYYPADLAVVPGKPEAIAIVRSTDPVHHSSSFNDVAIYVDGTRLPDTATNIDGNTIQFCGTADTLYAYQNLSSGYRLMRLAVDSAGVHHRDFATGLISGFWVTIYCDAARLYSTSGQVIDAPSNTLVGTFMGLSGNTLVSADASVGRVFFLTQVNAGAVGGGRNIGGDKFQYRLLAFDHDTFRQVWALDIPGIDGPIPFESTLGQLPRALVRWGANGLAFRASSTQVYLIQAPEIGGAACTSATPTVAPARPPATGTPRSPTATLPQSTAPRPQPTATERPR
jgi:hypothetical protein